jgi:hypothetical protein
MLRDLGYPSDVVSPRYGYEVISAGSLCPTKLCSHGPGVKTLGFQLKDGSSILLGNRVEGLFYLFTLGVIISGIMVISALNPVHSVL